MSNHGKNVTLALAGAAGGLVLGVVTLISSGWAMSTKAAEAVVAPMRAEFDSHRAVQEEQQKARDQRDRMILGSLQALCDAHPGAKCPLQ